MGYRAGYMVGLMVGLVVGLMVGLEAPGTILSVFWWVDVLGTAINFLDSGSIWGRVIWVEIFRGRR